MPSRIPAPLIAVISEIAAERETHASLDSLFLYAGAPGDPPPGSKQVKAMEWLRQVNTNESLGPLEVLGRIIENYMDEDLGEDEFGYVSPQKEHRQEHRSRIEKALARAELQYQRGGLILGALSAPSISLSDSIRSRNFAVLNEEFDRALRSVEAQPREAISAACNILESVCKIYIEEEKLESPAKQDLKSVWSIVRKNLGLDPSSLEDNDLKEILSGLIAVANGVGAFRTHASSAHGSGQKRYRVTPRHARLAVHASHTLALFILETWDERKRKLNNAINPDV
ncbi:MAG: abortive infection family protein [Nitrospira sp.]